MVALESYDEGLIADQVERLAEIVEQEERENQQSYRAQQRKLGEGKIRIGCQIETAGQMYALSIMSQLKANIIL